MTNYPESGIKLIADTKDYKSAMEEAIELAEYFDGLGDIVVSVAAEVDTSAFEELEDLPLDGETISVDVEADVELSGETLPFEEDSIDVGVEANVDVTGDELPVSGETIETDINVEETQTAKDTLSAVETIKNLKIIETVWNIAGTAVDIFKNFGGKIITPMLDLDKAVAQVNATTGGGIPNAKKLISDIFYDDLGQSIEQVANLVVKAGQLDVPIEEATRAALEFTHTFQEENPEVVLKALNALVLNKLAPNFKTAGDMLVTAFQHGADKGGDLLDTIGKNSVAIHDLGLTGKEAFSLIKTGLDAGFSTADEVIKLLAKIKQNVTNAAGNSKSDVSKTLDILGIANPAETGEAWSAEFFKKVIDGIKNAKGLSDTEKEALFTNLVGGKMGGKTFSAFLQLSPEDADFVFANMAGASERAATAIDDSLSGAINDFMLAANKAAQDFFSSEAIDLPGKIDKLKTGLQNGLAVLQEGGTLEDAFTIALKPIGLAEEFQKLESMLGNFIIAILQAVKAIQDITGDSKGAAGTKNIIAQMGEQQLKFDLEVSNPDEIAGVIETAVSRGVTPQQITDAVGGAVNNLIANGTPALAQSLLDAVVQAQTDANANVQLTGSGSLMNIEPVISEESLKALQFSVENAVNNVQATVDVKSDTEEAQTSLVGMQNQVLGVQDVLKTATDSSKQSVLDVQTQVLGLQTATENSSVPVTTMNTELNKTATAANTTADSADNLSESSDYATGSLDMQTVSTQYVGDTSAIAAPTLDLVAVGMDKMNTAGVLLIPTLDGVAIGIQKIIDTAGSLASASASVAKKQGELDAAGSTPVTGHASGTQDAFGTFMAGENGPEIITSNQHLGVLNNATTEKLMSVLQGYIPGGSFTSGSGNSYSVNNVNYVQSQAEADALGYRTAEQLRGMA